MLYMRDIFRTLHVKEYVMCLGVTDLLQTMCEDRKYLLYLLRPYSTFPKEVYYCQTKRVYFDACIAAH